MILLGIIVLEEENSKVSQEFWCERCKEDDLTAITYDDVSNTISIPSVTPIGIYSIQISLFYENRNDPNYSD